MKTVVLFFPDTKKMAEFILSQEIFQGEAYTREQSLIARLEEDSVITAILDYGGHLNKEWPFDPVSSNEEVISIVSEREVPHP